MNCLVCQKESEPAEADYCPAHNRAYDSVKHAFKVWTTAYGELFFSDFLKRISELPETGQYAREMVEFLRRNPARWK